MWVMGWGLYVLRIAGNGCVLCKWKVLNGFGLGEEWLDEFIVLSSQFTDIAHPRLELRTVNYEL
jgi:hypothetical protein